MRPRRAGGLGEQDGAFLGENGAASATGGDEEGSAVRINCDRRGTIEIRRDVHDLSIPGHGVEVQRNTRGNV